jgi:glycosyltransferase involved in cell wall biosynthesis
VYALVGDSLKLPSHEFDAESVLIVAGTLHAGGAERQATNTACGLAKRWPGKIHVAYSSSDASLDFYKPALDAANVLTHPITHVAEDDPAYSSSDMIKIRNELAARYASLGFLNIFYVIFHHALLIQKIGPGLIHTFQDYSNVLTGIAADLVGVPRLVLSGRSLAPEHFSIFQPYMAPGYHALLQRRKVVFLNNSEAGAKDYSRWLSLPRSDFSVINNGFEFPKPQATPGAAQRRALGVPEGAVLVGSVIGFREEKRPHLFLEMARVLHADYPDVHFVIFGAGALLEECREWVKSHGLAGIIHLPGLTADAWAALSAMDIFVLPSRLEGLPNVLIEAQAMGVPIVCSEAGGMAETFVAGETGFGVPFANAEALAAAVRRLVDDEKLRTRMGAAAERHVRNNFSIDRMIGLTVQAYAHAPGEIMHRHAIA